MAMLAEVASAFTVRVDKPYTVSWENCTPRLGLTSGMNGSILNGVNFVGQPAVKPRQREGEILNRLLLGRIHR